METPLVEADVVIDATPDAVWRVMTGQTSAMFMGARVATDWVPGHDITFAEWKGRPYQDHGEIRTVDEGRELAFTHYSPLSGKADRPESYNLVRYVLAPAGDGTKVTVSQTPLGDADDVTDEQKVEYRKTWSTMLQGLKDACERPAARRDD